MGYHFILDCAIGPLDDPASLDRQVRSIPDVVEAGLFLRTAHTVLVADGERIREMVRRET